MIGQNGQTGVNVLTHVMELNLDIEINFVKIPWNLRRNHVMNATTIVQIYNQIKTIQLEK